MTEFAEALKSWRKLRRFSQLDLATEAEISSRHLSFLETGRSRPSREMVLRLSETLQLPLEAQNQFLTRAGFAAKFAEHDWTDAEMRPIRQAVERTLTQHAPFPGLALDRRWRMVMANRTAETLFGAFGIGIGDSLVDLMKSDVLPQVVENWPDVAHAVALRLRMESLSQGGIPEFDSAAAHLAEFGPATEHASSPVIPTVVAFGDTRLSMFGTIAQFGTPRDVTLDDLKVELYFPMDSQTEAAFADMGAG